MKTEIEVKILDIDVPALKKRLKAIDAKRVFAGLLTTTYYDSTDGSFKKSGKTLRLRSGKEKGDKDILCLKVKRKDRDVKRADEYELAISDPQTMHTIILQLGFKQKATESKFRTSYAVGNSSVEINVYKNVKIPAFIEIESPSKKKLFYVVRQLGYTPAQTNTMTVGDLMRHYGVQRK